MSCWCDGAERARRHEVGVSFPVLCRASFGVRGANVQACLRADRRLRLVRHPDVDRRAGAAHAADRGVERLGGCAGRRVERVRDLLGAPGRADPARPGRHQDPRSLVGAAAAGGRRGAAGLGDPARRRPGPCAVRVEPPPDGQHLVLAVVPGGADRQRRLLGDPQPQHPGFHPLRPQPAVTGARAGAGPADDDDTVRVHRGCSSDQRDDRHLRRGGLGFRWR